MAKKPHEEPVTTAEILLLRTLFRVIRERTDRLEQTCIEGGPTTVEIAALLDAVRTSQDIKQRMLS